MRREREERRRPTARPWSAAVLLGMASIAGARAPSAVSAQEAMSGFAPESARTEARYEARFLDAADSARVRGHHEYFRLSPSEEGTPGAWRRVTYIERELESYGLDADIQTFYPYMADSREVRVSVEMVAPDRMSLPVKERRRPWHENFEAVSVGFSEGTPAADVTAEAVYANYGRAEDYEVLERSGVEVEGRIVLVRFGGTQRSEKPYQAYLHGAAGLIMYSDPADDGYARGEVYPDGPWRAPDGIQRGTVYRWTLYTGDPLTPGWAATRHAPRIPVEESNVARIPPTTPIGYGAAEPLMENLTGPEAPGDWQGGFSFPYRLGGPGSTEVRLRIEVEYEPRAAWNVIARIPGSTHPDEWVVIGTHPDTWAYGARDNTSGVSSQLEMARGLGELLRAGWSPKRTLVLAFFGAEERGITGSTEFTELLGREGMKRVVAFVNWDGTAGPNFRATAVPALDDLLYETARRIEWPGARGTLYEDWSGRSEGSRPRIRRPGGGTDYMPFLERFGTPVISIGSGAPGGRYHCVCDDLYALERFNDPGMVYQTAVSRMVGLLGMRLAGADVLPFRYSRYAAEVAGYLREFDELQRSEHGRAVVELSRDIRQAERWTAAARTFEEAAGRRVSEAGDEADFELLNRALKRMEPALLVDRGLPGRSWYTHQIYAPQFHNGFAVRRLPALHDALYVQEDEESARAYESDLHDSLRRATEILEAAISAEVSRSPRLEGC